MRILYVHNSADIYGASRSLLRLLGELDRAFFVPVVLLPSEGSLADQLRAMQVRVRVFPSLCVITRDVFHSWRLPFFLLNIPFSALRLWRIIEREEIDLVHTNTGVILSSGPAAWFAGVRHFWHFRDSFQEFRSFWWIYEGWVRFFSDRILAVSQAIAAQFRDRSQVRVIHNGFDVDEFAVGVEAGPDFREKYRLGSSLVVGCVGRIKLQRKGQEVLIEAARLLKERGVRAKFLIVGAPYPGNESHLAKLRDQAERVGLSDDVVFAGEIDDPRSSYAAMDVFVLPSAQPEPFGGVVMEAMCMRLPVVATGIGGSVEQVAEGETGFLVPPGDAEALAGKLQLLLADADLRKRFGESGHLRVKERFALKEMANAISEMYVQHVRPMRTKVLFVNNSADVYGASRCLVRLISRLDRTRFEPVVIIPENGPLEADLRREKVETIVYPHLSAITREVFYSWKLVIFLLNIPRSIWLLRRLIKKHAVHLVHTNTGVMLAPGPAAWLAGVPNVWHIRDYFQEFSSFWPLYAVYIRLFSSQIVAVSTPVARQFPASYGVKVAHDGFELEEFAESDPVAIATFREKYHLNGTPVIGCVGRLKLMRKGQEFLIQAAGLLKQRGVRVKLLIVGAPFPGNESHLEKMQNIARDSGIADDVIFTGELRNPRSAYGAMDVAVLPSAQPEPFGGVVMEAMCMSMPVVATNVGGSTEQVADGETGFLVPPADPVALADKLERLATDAALRKRFGEAGQRRITERFTLTGMVEKIVRIYDDVLATR